jgi:hypothetical protein
LQLVGVPDVAVADNARTVLFDPISLTRDLSAVHLHLNLSLFQAREREYSVAPPWLTDSLTPPRIIALIARLYVKSD